MCLVCLICVRIAIYKEHRLDTHNNKPAIDRIFWLEPTLSTATLGCTEKNMYFLIQSAFGIWILNDKRNHFLKS